MRPFGTRMPENISIEISRRTEPSGYYSAPATVVRASLERYFATLRDARIRLRAAFDGDEQALIADILNGTLFDTPIAVGMFWMEIREALATNDYAEKWGIDGQSLVRRLRSLDYAHAAAFVDAVERFWHRVGRGEQPDPRVLLVDVPTHDEAPAAHGEAP